MSGCAAIRRLPRTRRVERVRFNSTIILACSPIGTSSLCCRTTRWTPAALSRYRRPAIAANVRPLLRSANKLLAQALKKGSAVLHRTSLAVVFAIPLANWILRCRAHSMSWRIVSAATRQPIAGRCDRIEIRHRCSYRQYRDALRGTPLTCALASAHPSSCGE